jgi:hypothetical protein
MGTGKLSKVLGIDMASMLTTPPQVCWIYVSEIPTARLRGLNVSLAAATQWLFNLVIARAVPNMLTTMGEGGYGAFIAFSCFCFSMFIFVWFLVPETKVSSSSSLSF